MVQDYYGTIHCFHQDYLQLKTAVEVDGKTRVLTVIWRARHIVTQLGRSSSHSWSLVRGLACRSVVRFTDSDTPCWTTPN